METLTDLKTILHSKRANIYYIEHCRVMVKDGRVVYLTEARNENHYWNIPIANTTVILLGIGTSITQAAVRMLASAGVLIGFSGSGGTPLIAGNEIEWLSPQSEYRPTEYVQGWLKFWFDPDKRLIAAKDFQHARIDFIKLAWESDRELKSEGFYLDDLDIQNALNHFHNKIQTANSINELLLIEAQLTKSLYKVAANRTKLADFVREYNGEDDANAFLNHGNYLTYGLAATTLWVLGIPHGFAVMHGKTRRGALVFDVADLIKDALVLPWAFICAKEKMTEQEFRQQCLQNFIKHKALDFMFEFVKTISLKKRFIMMVIFVSQCEKNALSKTRRVLDSFANRIGDRTWQTVITSDGLNAVKKLLSSTASKNTAVACHWIRGRSRSELVWIIGNRSAFNSEGIVPVNFTQNHIKNWENDWHYLPLIRCLVALSALLHDFGKACEVFQEKLCKNRKVSDPLRHEWISALLFNSFVRGKEDDEWLEEMARGDFTEKVVQNFGNIQKPLADLSPAASVIAWLIVSHHKLPIISDNNIWKNQTANNIKTLLRYISSEWGYKNVNEEENLNKCFNFPHGLPSGSKILLNQMQKWARKLRNNLPLLNKSIEDGSWRVLLHHARLAMMLGDHHVSSQPKDLKWKSDSELFANTEHGKLKQQLDEHLVNVARAGLEITCLLPYFEDQLKRAYDGAKTLLRKSPKQFAWQDKAVEKIKEWKNKLPTSQQGKPHGMFIVNMASTGCGKTFANPKIMQALSHDGISLRYILALGLRTLTLQTGDEYKSKIGLDSTELAILIGSKAVMDLHNASKSDKEHDEEKLFGSESSDTLLSEDDVVYFEGGIEEEKLNTILKKTKDRQFLYAPVLVCTIDHIIQATECIKGGRYILPCLRLMSSDLVIDEVDDFDGKDLIAIGRLIHLAGMLGRKVMISSATIPPDLAAGYFNVYREGWKLFARTRDVSESVGCVWVDEFNTQIETCVNTAENDFYKDTHEKFTSKKAQKILQQVIKRRAEIAICHDLKCDKQVENSDERQSTLEKYFNIIQNHIAKFHDKHFTIDPITQKHVSFGVVRIANINNCIALAKFLSATSWPEEIDIRVMPYHSQQILLLRGEQEKHLDKILKRTEKNGEVPAAFKDKIIRNHLDSSAKKNVIFILVATPVEEVGRDHDFDWAIIEPSSFRSIIQLCGRILRHRDKSPSEPNVAIMQYNIRALICGASAVAYCRPGYETNDNSFKTHDIKKLIGDEFLEGGINSLPRIIKNKNLNPKENFSDLEHEVISEALVNFDGAFPSRMLGWLSPHCWWMTALPQKFNPFRDSDHQEKVYLIPCDSGFGFYQKTNAGEEVNVEPSFAGGIVRYNERLPNAWLNLDYLLLLGVRAELEDITIQQAAYKYGELVFPNYGKNNDHSLIETKYFYSYDLGMWTNKGCTE